MRKRERENERKTHAFQFLAFESEVAIQVLEIRSPVDLFLSVQTLLQIGETALKIALLLAQILDSILGTSISNQQSAISNQQSAIINQREREREKAHV